MLAINYEIRSIISQFIQSLHNTGGAISHVTVTVHGELQHFVPDRPIHHFDVTKMEGTARLSYQDMKLDAPIENLVTIVATEKKQQQV